MQEILERPSHLRACLYRFADTKGEVSWYCHRVSYSFHSFILGRCEGRLNGYTYSEVLSMQSHAGEVAIVTLRTS